MFEGEVQTLTLILFAFSFTYIIRCFVDLSIPIWDKRNPEFADSVCYYFHRSLASILAAYLYDFFPVLLI